MDTQLLSDIRNTVFQHVGSGNYVLVRHSELEFSLEPQPRFNHNLSGIPLESIPVLSDIAMQAIESGFMRMLSKYRYRCIVGWAELGFTDSSKEYWVMLQ